ncbi:exosome RNA helicase MTR4-like [Crassostrea virginica]
MMDVVNAWCNGATFSQICKMTNIFEGSIIRCMRRLEETLRQLMQAAKAIGNSELENKFAEVILMDVKTVKTNQSHGNFHLLLRVSHSCFRLERQRNHTVLNCVHNIFVIVYILNV